MKKVIQKVPFRLYRRVLEIEPDHAKSHLALGDNLYAKGDTETALQHYQKAVALIAAD